MVLGPLGSFLPKSNEAKKGQPPTPKASWVPNHTWVGNPNLPKNDQKDFRTQIGHFQPLASGNHQRPPAQVQKAFPSIQGKNSPLQMYSVPRIQAWCIYGIIYHYAPMLMFSGTNYSITIQVPKCITHFEGRPFSHSVLQSMVATRRPFRDPNHWPCRIIPRVISRGDQTFNHFSRHQVL
ncbi:hypothetical protein O181_029704 [Austropuccinia psidii MF-1]|uniref:Uncharacterized protein n=1 Tax=Austropuccinia psidii MF-1 TaxID=1389203 RepID=A0A9Q3CRD8_9BASI|nr:hypothetical protein [Austropuccinia psidii MF-1]